MCHRHNEKDINHQNPCLKIEGSRGVAGARDSLKKCIAYPLENGTATYYKDRGHYQVCKLNIIGKDRGYLYREYRCQCYDRNGTQQAVFQDFPDGGKYHIGATFPNDFADKSVGGSGESEARDDEDQVNASCYGGDTCSGLAHLLYKDKKDEPYTERE